MCGIVGFHDRGADWSEDGLPRRVLRQMREKLAHRGPDAEGELVDRELGLVLGHRRLSIIDLAGGAQPMSTPGGALSIVFNGEIYNFQALRAELEAEGHVFVTRSDTEVLLAGCRQWGFEKLLPRLNGMFAFALLDRKRARLTLARDPVGEKPLYYCAKNGFFAFASEPKALLEHPRVSRATSVGRAQAYLAHDYVPGEASIWSDLRKVGPGRWVSYDLRDGTISQGAFYERKKALELGPVAPDELLAQAAALVEDSVRLRLVSDVPLGIFLSGGIDSSLVLAAAARSRDPRQIETFGVSFDERGYDESRYAKLMAGHVGAKHHILSFRPKEMQDAIPEVLSSMDEPFGDASLLPTYFLCRAARRSITVALSGDGGDELFAGYDTFKALRLKGALDLMPRVALEGARGLARLLPVSNAHFSLAFRLEQLLKGARAPLSLAVGRWMASLDLPEQRKLFSARLELEAEDALYQDYLEADDPRADPLTRLGLIYQGTYLVDDILVKSDRASMMTSLEVRPPLLDPRLVDFANRLHGSQKMKLFSTKQTLKALLKRYGAPREIYARGKKGFAVPVAAWLRGPLRQWAGRYFSREFVRRQGLFSEERVERLFAEHLSGRFNHRKALWTLLCFQVWWERYQPNQTDGTRV